MTEWGAWLLLPVSAILLWLLASSAWRRAGRRRSTLVITPNFLLIALPTILASSAVSPTGSLYVIALVATITLGIRSPNRVKLTWPCAILPIIALAIVLRPNYPSTNFSVAFFLLGCIITARGVQVSDSRSSALVSLLDGVGVYLFAVTALWLVGFQGTEQRTAGLDNALTGGDRVVFPLSDSLVVAPNMAAVYIAAIIPVLILVRRHRLPRLFGGACAVAILILSDARVSLIGAVLLAASVLLIPRLFRAAAPWVVTATLSVPFIYPTIQYAVGQTVTSAGAWVPWLIRRDEKVGTLNQRDYIWSQAISFYANRIDWVHQMTGFGSYGQAESGASSYYNHDFVGFGELRLLTPHNSVLQILFDGGWLVTAAFMLVVISMAFTLSRRARASLIDAAGLASLPALAIVGTTEVALSPSHAQPTWWTLLALGMIVFSKDKRIDVGMSDTSPRVAAGVNEVPPDLADCAGSRSDPRSVRTLPID